VSADTGGRSGIRRLLTSHALLVAALLLAVLFATGVGSVPHSPVRGVVYDLVLFNAIPLIATVISLQAAHRVRGERVVWSAIALMWFLTVVGNVILSLAPPAGAADGFPPLVSVCYLAEYPLIAFSVVRLLHVRGAHLQPSAWLDGATAALGVTACAAAYLLAPEPVVAGLEHVAVALPYAGADVVLLALVAAVIAVLGLHIDRGLLLIAAALVAKLAGDVLLARAETHGGYVVGGPVDLTWIVASLAGMTAAHLARAQPDGASPAPQNVRTGWRVLVIPLACTVASLLVLGIERGDGTTSLGEVCALGCVATALARATVTFRELLGLQEARQQAATDDLTGLPNRRALIDAAEKQVASGQPTALLLLDLDGFKAVNDGLGHRAGDDLLCMLGGRIRPALRPTDVLARFGGDEFAVLLPGTSAAAAFDIAQRVHRLICVPVTVTGVVLNVGASIGVATSPDHADNVAGLLHCADTAMYAAKSAQGGVRAYSPGLDQSSRRLPRASDPARTNDSSGHVLTRPFLDLAGRAVWADVLVRRADGALVGADLSTVEGLLPSAARWWTVLPLPVRITLPTDDVDTSRLPDRIAAGLLRHGLPPEALLLRVTVEAIACLGDRLPAVIAALSARGLRTTVDGHGPGVFALAGLRDLSADHLHLDPALTRDVVADQRSCLVVGHTVALARALGTDVSADAADEHTNAVLSRLGCMVLRPLAQPVPGDELEEWLRRRDHVRSPA
jgi:diguanylate cyclase (GGDEF)-like protein